MRGFGGPVRGGSPGLDRAHGAPPKAARAALARRLKVKATLRVTFTPFGGSPSSRIVQVKLKALNALSG